MQLIKLGKKIKKETQNDGSCQLGRTGHMRIKEIYQEIKQRVRGGLITSDQKEIP